MKNLKALNLWIINLKPSMNKWMIIAFLFALVVPYAVGQWIDNEPLVSKDLKLKTFWKCPYCED